MKKLILCILSYLFLNNFLYSQSYPSFDKNNNWKKEKLNGKVKSCEEFIFVAYRFGELQKKDGNNILLSRFSSELGGGSMSDRYRYEYDENGNYVKISKNSQH